MLLAVRAVLSIYLTLLPFKEEVVTVLLQAVRGVLSINVTLLPFKEKVVTVLLLAVRAVLSIYLCYLVTIQGGGCNSIVTSC